MAEAVGAIASAATLFELCVRGFDFVHTIQQHEADLHKLTIRLSIERCRLYIWGEMMGLTTEPTARNVASLESCRFLPTVENALRLILETLDHSERTRQKYGYACIEDSGASNLVWDSEQTSGVVHRLNTAFRNFKVSSRKNGNQPGLSRKTFWAIRDKTKFEKLIVDAKGLIDGLQDITKDIASSTQQHHKVERYVQSINDIETLEAVAEACRTDYPSISDVASIQADGLSTLNTVQQNILDWTNGVEEEEEMDGNHSDGMTIEAIESMTVTELKHTLSSALLRRKTSNQDMHQHQHSLGGTTANGDGHSRSHSAPIGNIVGEHGNMATSSINAAQDEEISEEITIALKDPEFMDELSAIKNWFKVLSDGERCCAMQDLLAMLRPVESSYFARSLAREEAGVCPQTASVVSEPLRSVAEEYEHKRFLGQMRPLSISD